MLSTNKLLAALCCALLSACGHPTGVMQPVVITTATPKTMQVNMLVATTRQPSGDPRTLFMEKEVQSPL